MLLSLAETCNRLGCTPRQLRYRIGEGTLPAHKVDGRWVIDEADLPKDDLGLRRRQAKAEDLQAAVQGALAPHVVPTRRYGAESIHAFTAGVLAWQGARQLLGLEHAATRALAAVNLALSRGIHAFGGRPKLDAFHEARARGSEAVAWLFMEGTEGTAVLARQVEDQVLAPLGGLIRRVEPRNAL